MREYNVEITDDAFADMQGIYSYIADTLRSPAVALNQYKRIAEAIDKLSTFPKRIKPMDTDDGNLEDLRQLIVDNFSVFFLVEESKVIVTRVLYGRCDTINRLLTE